MAANMAMGSGCTSLLMLVLAGISLPAFLAESTTPPTPLSCPELRQYVEQVLREDLTRDESRLHTLRKEPTRASLDGFQRLLSPQGPSGQQQESTELDETETRESVLGSTRFQRAKHSGWGTLLGRSR